MLLKAKSDGGNFFSFLYLTNILEPKILSTVRKTKTAKSISGREDFLTASVPTLIAKQYENKEGAETALNHWPHILRRHGYCIFCGFFF